MAVLDDQDRDQIRAEVKAGVEEATQGWPTPPSFALGASWILAVVILGAIAIVVTVTYVGWIHTDATPTAEAILPLLTLLAGAFIGFLGGSRTK